MKSIRTNTSYKHSHKIKHKSEAKHLTRGSVPNTIFSDKRQATSNKQQATSNKRQATSDISAQSARINLQANTNKSSHTIKRIKAVLRPCAFFLSFERPTGLGPANPKNMEVKDVVSGKVNEVLTKGGVVQLVGSRLKFDAKDAVQGIFFVPETGEAVRATVIAENKPARLMAIIPAGLKAGTYYIEVRTKIDMGGKKLKTLKTGRFAKPLTVTA